MIWMSARSALLAILLVGCATTSGPDTVLTAKGPAEKTLPQNSGNATRFLEDANASFAKPSDPALARQMLETGFDYIAANCSDFFSSAGQTQKWLIVARDTVGAVGTLATAGLALADKGSNAIAAIGLGTSIAFSGIDIYTKNFLFSAENIESVRTLTMHALDVHRQAVEKISSFTYTNATVALLDNQNICSPMQIAALSRDAIKKGDVTASSNPTDDLKAADQARDQKVLRDLGKDLGLGGAIRFGQAGALWWLYKSPSEPTKEEISKFIFINLASLPDAMNPVTSDGERKPGWAKEDKVSDTLDYFSSSTIASFEASISDAKKKESGGVAPTYVPGSGPAVNFTPPSAPGAPQSAHISVSIK